LKKEVGAKYLQICRVLRNRILRGEYADRFPSERAIAKELRTNPKTVQVAIAQLEAIGLVNRIQRQGTFVSTPAQKGDSSSTSGVFVRMITPDWSESRRSQGPEGMWWSPVLFAFQQAAQRQQMALMLWEGQRVDIAGVALAESRNPHCAGTCILAMPVDAAAALRLAQSPSPIVAADWEPAELLIPSVVFDNVLAGRLAAGHLVSLGHRHVLVSLTPMHRLRQQGATEAFDMSGVRVTSIPYDPEALAVVLEMFRRDDRPTAVICDSSGYASNLIPAIEQIGLRVPIDVSVVSFGQHIDSVNRRLTTVALDMAGMGRRAFEILLDETAMTTPRRELIGCSLSQSASSGPAPIRP
jgi:DNA-binding LacI/PurR family transcriptional regulator